ncbi:MAG: hypothetical protein IKU15_03495 [Clostridia bacterium]|nr:hypothetical protein [Clostridia bacterium]
MERTDYLIYGTHIDTPWDETLLAIVDSQLKADDWISQSQDGGEWTNLRYEAWKVQ